MYKIQPIYMYKIMVIEYKSKQKHITFDFVIKYSGFKVFSYIDIVIGYFVILSPRLGNVFSPNIVAARI